MKKQNRYKSTNMTTFGETRIIAGQWRNRKIEVIDSDGLRPTTNRIKETLFNWISPHIVESVCMDVYAGSGSLGFEAASRYAKHVTLLEQSSTATKVLQRNCNKLTATNVKIENVDALAYLEKGNQQEGARCDIVFIDPPFHKGLLSQTAHLLERGNWLKPAAYIYAEAEASLEVEDMPQNWQLYREKKAGQVCFRLYKKGTH